MFNWLNMKYVFLSIFSVLLIDHAFGQTKEITFTTHSFKSINTTGLSNFIGEKQKRWVKIDDVVVETSNIALTPVEETLARAESMEIKAVVKHDTVALKRIWLRDFTFDEQHNKVHHDRNLLPHYLSLHRRIEKIFVTGDHAYVSGTEYAVAIMEGSRVDSQVERKYSHLWVKELFGWKLASKSYN